MSQITRCPQCQTRFKVVDDQLRISDGWVRCGKCKSVFDALTHLVARSASDAQQSDPKPPVVSAPPPAPVEPPPATVAPQPASVQLPTSTPVPAPTTAPAVVASAPPSVPAAVSVAGAVMVTENSMAVDPHANVPELSVLVFPRRAGFGDSGYVDSSWMSAYENDAALPVHAAGVQTSVAGAAPAAGAANAAPNSADAPSDAALESEWSAASDVRPESLRSASVGFSAQDDLAELQAREGRLLEAIAEQKSKTETKQVALDRAGLSAKAVLKPAPAPQSESVSAAESEGDFQENTPPAHDQRALNAPEKVALNADKQANKQADQVAPTPADEDVLYAKPELAGRTIEPGKVEPALDAPHNYVAEIDAASPASEAAPDEPSFVRDAKRKAFWSKPSVVVLSLLCALMLLAGLLVQVAVKQRDQLAVQYPQLRPVLGQVCKLAGCQLGLPRDLQRISIDSTSFNPIGPRQFKLTVVLRNAADYAVAVPALELSLNDAAEKLVLRRVLTAADMKAPAELPAHGEWTAVVPIQVAEPRQDVVGYRVLAFYP